MQVAVILDGYCEVRGAGTAGHRGGRVDFTLTFDSSPIKGEGILSVGVVLLLPRPVVSRLRRNDGPGLGVGTRRGVNGFCKGLVRRRHCRHRPTATGRPLRNV